jgi:lauroyl/myristoyl acyltransferase
LPPSERRKFLGLSLLGRLWRALYFDALAQGPPELVARLTRVIGWDNFVRCRADGTGLILLVVHGQFVRLSQPYLRARGYDGIDVGVPRARLEQQGLVMPVAKRFELAGQMHAAKHLLARGGLVFNPPDARQNLDHSRTVEFFGRQRQIAAGFAELALKTGARMVPMAHRFTVRGSFVLEFGAPFHVPGPESPHDERVDALVAQYASFLHEQWRLYPWNIPWNHLLHHCQLPVADSTGLGAKRVAPLPPEASSNASGQELAR